ncbi:hypothetical protein F5883DRAFT_718938 [Diaporthe sp. PMI_573]|nr:hypothetical protein F5883DRAFT_718938 [Diaporthaceae sp. PMI_573]
MLSKLTGAHMAVLCEYNGETYVYESDKHFSPILNNVRGGHRFGPDNFETVADRATTSNEAASDQTAAETRSEVYRAEQKLLIDAFFSSHPDLTVERCHEYVSSLSKSVLSVRPADAQFAGCYTCHVDTSDKETTNKMVLVQFFEGGRRSCVRTSLAPQLREPQPHALNILIKPDLTGIACVLDWRNTSYAPLGVGLSRIRALLGVFDNDKPDFNGRWHNSRSELLNRDYGGLPRSSSRWGWADVG